MAVDGHGLRLVPVGVGAAYGLPGEAQSCYLVRYRNRVLCLDLGAGALNRIPYQVGPERIELLFITHLHPDHCADLLALRVYMAWGPGRGTRMRVIGPPGLRERLVGFAGEEGWDDAFAFEELREPAGSIDLDDGMRLTYREVPHLPPTYAVGINLGSQSIVYSADCAPNDALPELARGADVLVAECSLGAGPLVEGVPHLNAAAAAEIANRAGVGRLLLTHCYPEHDRDEALAAARAVATMPVAWALQDLAERP